MKIEVAKIIALKNEYKYVAVDRNGDIHMFFDLKPYLSDDEWCTDDNYKHQGCAVQIYLGAYQGKKPWKKTLVEAKFDL